MFDVEIIDEADAVRVRLAGECDLLVAGTIGSTLSQGRGRAGQDRTVIVDLRDVTFIDSLAMDMLVMAHRGAARNGWPFAIIPGPPQVQRAFEVIKLDRILPFSPRRD